jgi:hypothetical protein
VTMCVLYLFPVFTREARFRDLMLFDSFPTASAVTGITLTCVRGIADHGRIIGVVACTQYQVTTLPKVRSTHARAISIIRGDLPSCSHLQRLGAIFSASAIINFVHVQCHEQVGAVTLRGRWGRGASVRECAIRRRQGPVWSLQV